MHGLKSAILAALSEISWLAVLAIPVSAALQNRQQDFFLFHILIFIYFSKYETIVRSIAPGLLVIRIQIQAV